MHARIFDIKRDCSEDGPGIRTTVSFKGCPLHCVWCQNPEAQNDARQIVVTPIAASTDKNQTLVTQQTGYDIELEELLYKVLVDKPFFQSSGGGVTVSGGEATTQMDFLHAFLKRLKQESIHTTLETSGFFNYRRFKEELLPYLDLVYFDLKLMDDDLSRRYTGQGSTLIQQNFTRLTKEKGFTLVPRIPLIPDITTTKDNLQKIAQFLRNLDISTAVLLSYNPLWLDKLPNLNLHSDYQRRAFMSAEEKQTCIDYFYSIPITKNHRSCQAGT